MDGRLEYFCKHGVGHTIYAPFNSSVDFIPGCDGCCEDLDVYDGNLKRIEKESL